MIFTHRDERLTELKMIDGNNDVLVLNQSVVETDDVRQEVALRELETGKKVSLRIVFNYLASTDRVLYYGTYNHRQIEEAKIPWSTPEGVSQRVINTIIDWALIQSPEFQGIVFNFLDLSIEEKEESLPRVLEALGLAEAIEIDKRPKKKIRHMSDIMRDSLPATKDELISLIQSLSVETKRPAATVRQFLREGVKKNQIFLGNDTQYHLVTKD